MTHETPRNRSDETVPKPLRPPTAERQPASITFYMRTGERAEVLRVLRSFHARRTPALLAALGIEHGDES